MRTASLLFLSMAVTVACNGTLSRSSAPAATMADAPAPIAFIEDDWTRAVTAARAKGVPLFVDAWASWCHSCLSMRAFVFKDPLVLAKQNEFVWLAIDTEKSENAAFLHAHPMEVWPTLWVIDANTDTPALRWNGSATATELVSLLDDARVAIARGTPASGEATAAYLRGNQETARGEADLAIASYRAALAAAPLDWPRRTHTIEALSSRLKAKNDCPAQLDLSALELPRIAPGTSAKSLAQDALGCLVALYAKGDGTTTHRAAVLAAAEKIAGDMAQPLLADDRSDLYAELADTFHELGDEASSRRIARVWAAFLEGEAARASSPEARVVFDPQRYEAYVMLGEPERAVPMLQESEREFPRDYNPPARLAGAYLKMKKLDDAVAAIDRALALAHGPRRLRLYTMKADILAAKHDKAGERATVDEALAQARGMVLMGSVLKIRDALEERAAALRRNVP